MKPVIRTSNFNFTLAFTLSLLASSLSSLLEAEVKAANADPASAKKNAAVSPHPLKSKPQVLPWDAFGNSDEDDTRSYNLIKNHVSVTPPKTNDPKNWRTFDPTQFANKLKLVPSAVAMEGAGPAKYASTETSLPQDPSKSGIMPNFGNGNSIVFAHQGTPLASGWIAPKAGYAYMIDKTLVFGTTNYTPINYNGEMEKYIGVNKIPVDIMSASGSKQLLDLSRLVFSVNDQLVAQPHSKVYPSAIYLKRGETASIHGFGNVNCPPTEQPQEITVPTATGEQKIKVFLAPDDPVIPGKVTP